jgi:hypothetical protein
VKTVSARASPARAVTTIRIRRKRGFWKGEHDLLVSSSVSAKRRITELAPIAFLDAALLTFQDMPARNGALAEERDCAWRERGIMFR